MILRFLVASVNLRTVPPMRDLVDEGDGRLLPARRPSGVRLRLADEHFGLTIFRPRGIIVGQRDLVQVAIEHLAVIDPVAVLKLNPGRSQHVEKWDLLHLGRFAFPRPSQQFPANLARIWRHQPLAGLRTDCLHVDIPEKSRAGGAFLGVRQIIPTSIRRPEMGYSFGWYLACCLKTGESSRRISIFEI